MYLSRSFFQRRQRLIFQRAFSFGVGAVLVHAAGCTPQKIDLHLRPEVRRPAVSVVVFFVDGLDRSTLELMRRFGRTPNIDKIFEDGGVEVKNAIDCIPSTTYPNTVSLFTGMFPGHHGVIGNSWFDPVELISTYYMSAQRYKAVNEHFKSKTLYEYLNDHFTFNIQCPTQRGVAQTVDNAVAAGFAYAIGAFVNIDQMVGSNVTLVAEAANRRGQWPSVVVHYFPGVDEIGHLAGADSRRYRHAIENVDHQIGRIASAITRAAPAEKVYFILVSDHGHFPVKSRKVVPIDEYLRRDFRLKVFSGLLEQSNIEARKAALREYDAAVLHPSARSCQIYLRGPKGWGGPLAADTLLSLVGPDAPGATSPLLQFRGVGLVCVPLGPGRVRVQSEDGTAIIERRTGESGSQYRYISLPDDSADDALEYFESTRLREFAAAGWHSSREWLAATAGSDYPDFVPQIVEYFDSPRAGHVVVFPEEDFVFAKHGEGEHGACYRRDMRVPLYFAGPDLPHDAEIGQARIVDVMPTILQMLGEEKRLESHPPLDGVGLLDELRRAAGN